MIFATVDSYGGDWVSALPMVEIGLRSAQHSTIKASPYEVIFGRKPRLPQFVPENMDLDEEPSPKAYLNRLERKRLELKERIRKLNNEKNILPVKNIFNIDERVMMECLPTQKLGVCKPRFEGPGIIVGIVNPNSYLVEFCGKIYRRHEANLKRFNQASSMMKTN